LARPTFKNLNTEGEKKFKELDTNGDLYLKKLKEREMLDDTPNCKTKIEEKIVEEVLEEKKEENQIEDTTEYIEEKVYYEEQKRFYPHKQKKQSGKNLYRIDDLWKIATKSTEHNEIGGEYVYSKTPQTKFNYDGENFNDYRKMKTEEFNLKKEKIVANVGKAKSIKDLFN